MPAWQDLRVLRTNGEAKTWLIIFALLILICYYSVILLTGRILLTADDMAHGLFAPLVAAYVGWTRREFLLHPVGPPSFWALPVLGFGACLGATAVLAQSSTFARFAFLLSIAGCLLVIGGGSALRKFHFPLWLLLFTFPIPDVLYGEATQPLQLLATILSKVCLELFGFSVFREGNILQLTHMRLSVIEACSGLRSLVTLSFVCIVYGYFFEDRMWIRACILVLAFPIAIVVNVLRITTTGVLGKYDRAWTEGFFHDTLGWMCFTLGVMIVVTFHHLARQWLQRVAEETTS